MEFKQAKTIMPLTSTTTYVGWDPKASTLRNLGYLRTKHKVVWHLWKRAIPFQLKKFWRLTWKTVATVTIPGRKE